MFNLKFAQGFSSRLSHNAERPSRNRLGAFSRTLLAGLIAVGLGGVAQAGVAKTPPAPTYLKIQNVFVDITAQEILILGQHFDNGSPLTITLANVGDISADCTGNFTVTPQAITCDLSGGDPAVPPAGDYLLTVSTAVAEGKYKTYGSANYGYFVGHYDHWDLTIGAVGPQGPAGPQGPPGTIGLAGQQCPTGESVVGFDASGDIVCSSTTPPPPVCANTLFTFNTTSSGGGAFSQAAWNGSTSIQAESDNAACTVTINQPAGAVDLVGGTIGATPWSVASFTGYSSCFLTTVSPPDCSGLSLSVSEPVVDNYPTCTSGLCDLGTCSTGVATASVQVTCNQ
jgi:hypothetical protein